MTAAATSRYHATPAPHVVMSRREWQQLEQRCRDDIVLPADPPAVAVLGGGYDGMSVYLDRCPCHPAPQERTP